MPTYSMNITACEKNSANNNFLSVLKCEVQTSETENKGVFGATQKPARTITFRVFGSNQMTVGQPVQITTEDWKISERLSPTTGYFLKYLDAHVGNGQGSFTTEKPADYQAPVNNNAVNTSATTQDDLPF